MLKILQQKIEKAFLQAGYDTTVDVLKSNRPDLSDFQCNDVLRLAKKEGKNPRDIAEKIVSFLAAENFFEKISVDGPGFINFTMTHDFWAQEAQKINQDSRLGIEKTKSPKKIVVDYGGPNVAKPLHAGHLRAAVIGESIKRILKFAGHEVTGDVHFGDWGLQMGLVLAEIQQRQIAPIYFDEKYTGDYPKESPVSMDDLADIYPSASKRAKEDEDFKKQAQSATLKLQQGQRGLQALWQHCHDISLDSIKRSYAALDIDFDLWMGESDVHNRIEPLMAELKTKGKIKLSEGAYVIDVKEEADKKEMPPVLVLKSNGSVGYHTTDIATIDFRIKELGTQEMIYVTDDRQVLHFEQLFRAVKKIGMVPQDYPFHHVAYGTMNGTDGKPFKTRAGGVLRLEDMIDILEQAGKWRLHESLKKTSSREGLARAIGVAALKFGDLINPPQSDYILDMDYFTNFEGKTGPYIQYTAVRVRSILSKTQQKGQLKDITDPTEKELIRHILEFKEAFQKSQEKLSPHFICVKMFEVAQSFNAFYHACPILGDSNEAHRIALCELTLKVCEIFSDLIGISLPKSM